MSMTDLTRTPGPWSVRRMSTGDWQVIGANGEDVTVIADDEPAEGDAHLMAAGPEMREALVAVLRAFTDAEADRMGIEAEDAWHAGAGIPPWLQRIVKPALAKAEGRVS